jgi:hypothetical protein
MGAFELATRLQAERSQGKLQLVFKKLPNSVVAPKTSSSKARPKSLHAKALLRVEVGKTGVDV